MRIAYLVHFYPPTPCGGAGYYTAMLAEAFQEAGHGVGVLCVDKWGAGRNYLNGRQEGCHNGVAVRRLLVNWKKAPRPLEWLSDSPVMGAETKAYLEEFRPDIVHVSSTYTLSARPILIAKGMGLPVVVHLHDFWFICARTRLLHKDGRPCSGPDSAWKCQKCLLAGSKLWGILSKVVPEPYQERVCKLMTKASWITRQRGVRGLLGDLEARRSVTKTALEVADALITPTAYARAILEAGGAPGNGRIEVMRCGGTWTWAKDLRRTEASHLRIGFLGNVMRTKGVHVLVEAYRLLRDAALPVELQVWGDTSHDPDYQQSLRRKAPEALWGGRYARSNLAHILSGLDVIVVPSVWHETQGIVIQEAFAAGLPAIVSADTSLTESVTHEGNGLYFEQGSAEDLARQIQRLMDDPALLLRLREGIPAVRGIEEDLQQLLHSYRTLVHRRQTGLS